MLMVLLFLNRVKIEHFASKFSTHNHEQSKLFFFFQLRLLSDKCMILSFKKKLYSYVMDTLLHIINVTLLNRKILSAKVGISVTNHVIAIFK